MIDKKTVGKAVLLLPILIGLSIAVMILSYLLVPLFIVVCFGGLAFLVVKSIEIVQQVYEED